jgi:isoleucyl-tRNA synthetase
VKAFNAECRRIVSGYDQNWREYIDRIGRWVDMEHPYRTLDRSFMESVIWAFAEAYKKGLIYKDYRVAPYCYRCETSLSLSEIRVDDATRPKQDRAITVKFALRELDGVSALAWTTTPWTLPSNLALAVGPEIEYVVANTQMGKVLLARQALKRYERELGKDPEVLATYSGQQLLEMKLSYEPLFPYFKDKRGFVVISADFVSTGDGTGIVHIAPAFGEDDYWACRAHNIEVQNPVDASGKFTAVVSDFANQNVHEANPAIIKLLKSRDVVVRDETIEHNYPHCWRCRTPLIYRALDAWYFKIEAIRQRLLETNGDINWYPDTVKHGRFGNWLENARDWNISRNRFWATPIPVWECKGCGAHKVYGSVAEIEQDGGGVKLDDLHKEFLDEVSVACQCGERMRRVPEVLDCWFESGSMPYGQYHYPFENAEHFREHFPADFIVEYTGQIRCWFYYLHVLSTAIFDKPAFKNCMVHGTLLAADGKKMSKSLKNYTDPLELMNRYGADALRAYLFSSPAVGLEDLSFRDEGVEAMVKSIMLPLWNALTFLTSYTEVDRVTPAELGGLSKDLGELDRFILSELELLNRRATELFEGYRINEAMRLFAPFLDTLNNWYIRRSRERVWSEDPRSSEKMAFYSTLYDVLSRYARLIAPLCPFISELVWERLGYSDSVHLAGWPDGRPELVDEKLSSDVNMIRAMVSAGLSVRAREKLRVRLPLGSAKVAVRAGVAERLAAYVPVLCGELNVKGVEFLEDSSSIATLSAKVNARVLGPRLGARVQEVIQKVRAGEFEVLSADSIRIGDIVLGAGEVEVGFSGKPGLAVESGDGFVVALDTQITPELSLEGTARDLVREIQDMRKEADLHIADRIKLSIKGADKVLAEHGDYIRSETLCVEFLTELPTAALIERGTKLDDGEARIFLVKA